MAENIPATCQRSRTRGVIKTITFTLSVSLVLLSGWTFVKYLRYASIQGYIVEGIRLSLSTFQIEIVLAGLTGLFGALLIQSRRRSRKPRTSPRKMTQIGRASCRERW